jgi:hypothetical protein
LTKSEKPPNFPEWDKIIESVTSFGQKLGPDTLIFAIVACGMFASSIWGQHTNVAVNGGIGLLVLWLVNKWRVSYDDQRKAEAKLKELKAIKGRMLLEKHKRKKVAVLLPSGIAKGKNDK